MLPLDLGKQGLCPGSHSLEGPIFVLLWGHPLHGTHECLEETPQLSSRFYFRYLYSQNSLPSTHFQDLHGDLTWLQPSEVALNSWGVCTALGRQGRSGVTLLDIHRALMGSQRDHMHPWRAPQGGMKPGMGGKGGVTADWRPVPGQALEESRVLSSNPAIHILMSVDLQD